MSLGPNRHPRQRTGGCRNDSFRPYDLIDRQNLGSLHRSGPPDRVFRNGRGLSTDISRWFDRRRGTAIALISSGQYIASVIWPAVFVRLISRIGWRTTYLGVAGILLLGVIPLAVLLLRPAPRAAGAASGNASSILFAAAHVLELRPNTVQTILCLAGFCCCVPMAIPQAHLVAFCGDIGLGAATGAMMLSALLGCAFISRQFWGAFADRYGGLKTVMAGSFLQAISIGAFLANRAK